ncbi:MAG: thioredoxin domain-containing protein [Thermodesulfovibrionales bacterium]|jgi:uncharacterized protein YyaL (SSP411 family)
MNRLAKEKAAYLRHAADQKIDWFPWSDEAFDRAEKDDKPVFLSSGAVWCHWCHVMAKECFENDEIIGLLNEKFINIKLDRDERPDIDRRYQQAVAAMGSGGGWPLSVFLTPERKPFFGGTYFPPDDNLGRPGFKKILMAVSEFYKSKKKDVAEHAERLLNHLKQQSMVAGDIDVSQLQDAEKTINASFDPQNGGFGSAPKFPMPGAMEFLMKRFFYSGEEYTLHAVKRTLESMAKGGIHDQIGGGFHRYATDEAWIIPHFEKMADDNAWLLRNYLDAYCLFGDAYFRGVAEDTIAFVRDVLSDPEGGFYASQDADVTPDDEGGYFTWRDEDFRKVLDEREYRVLSLHLLHDRGAMRHDSSQKVLFVAMEPERVAEKTGLELSLVNTLISRGKSKLLRERSSRKQPFIDKSIYTSLNGMLITSFLKAFRVLNDKRLRDFALKSIERIMVLHCINDRLYHSLGVAALLDDYVYLIEALTAAYEASGNPAYLNRADEFMGLCITRFWDNSGAGFFDTDGEVLGLRLKGIEDIPQPSADSIGIMLLDKLAALTGKDRYRQYALRAVRTFSPRARELGIHAGYYYASLDAYFHSLTISLESSPESELARAVRAAYHPYMNIRYGEERGYVVPCGKGKCYDPIDNADGLRAFLKNREWK